jgi:PmbA protein
MSSDLQNMTHALLEAARVAGADAADALAVEDRSVAVDVRVGALEQAERSEATDIGLRVFVGQRSAVVSGSDTRRETLIAMAERAVAMAHEAPEDSYAGIAEPDQLASDTDAAALDLFDPSTAPDPATLQEAARQAEAAAAAVDGVSQVQSASASHGTRRFHLATSAGFSAGYSRSGSSLSVVAIAGSGAEMERDYDGDSRIFAADLRDAAEIGATAGMRAVARSDPQRPKTGAYPVIFDERVSGSLIGHLLAAINGAAVARGGSWLRDALGEQVLPKGMSLIEDPLRTRVAGSRPFDGEGLPVARREVVADGILTGWTLDLQHARKLGMAATGNAARGTGGGPSPSNWNIDLTQGSQSLSELMSEMGTGLLVTSMIGATINPNTGDYSRGAAGLWIEGGVPVYPVSGVTIAGNLRAMLGGMTASNDARSWLSRRIPSLRVEGLTLAGD